MIQKSSVIHFETRRDNKTRWVKQAQLEGPGLAAWITTAQDQRCHDYQIRGMRERKERITGSESGRAELWLRIAALIATRQINSTGICQVLGISRNSVTRHLGDMQSVYGMAIEYVRPDGRKPGWYEIRDWGLLDEQKTIERYRPGSLRT